MTQVGDHGDSFLIRGRSVTNVGSREEAGLTRFRVGLRAICAAGAGAILQRWSGCDRIYDERQAFPDASRRGRLQQSDGPAIATVLGVAGESSHTPWV